ncbi:MAG TPA: LamG domain-containing protein [Candidatus Nanoarchaeia archaeon]|nr:LamG domain-containing protein [Candidatus Nanoarchaeia archaeon]
MRGKKRGLFFARHAVSGVRRFEISALILFAVLFVIVTTQGIVAVTLTCTINATSECSGSFLPVLYLQNETGGYNNSHAQNLTNTTFARYNYTVCCLSSASVLSTSCDDVTFLRLSNISDAHVQFGNYSGTGPAYNVSMCLSIDPGKISCTYQTNSNATCSSGYTCLGSMASDNLTVENQTNSHIGACTEYATKICCTVNDVPTISSVVLNASNATNYTIENLTVYFSQTDPEGDQVYNITDWMKNGQSIAVLNMPFDANTSSVIASALRDYSTYLNNGTLGGGSAASAPVWNSSGKVGGSYVFDGDDDYINLTNATLNGMSDVTASFWLKTADTGQQSIISGANDANNNEYLILFLNSTFVRFYTGESTGSQVNWSFASIANSAWHHFVFVRNDTGNSAILYVDGVLQSTQGTTLSSLTINASGLVIGQEQDSVGGGFDATQAFNGSLDELFLFNRVLSAGQIATIYQAGIENHSAQILHGDETIKGENWSAAITPTDGATEGITVTSYNLTILNSAPTAILSSPADGNRTTNRTPEFIWTGNDDDGDAITYQFNITCQPTPGSCGDNRLSNLTTTSYIISPELRWLDDYGNYYVWSVRANDSAGYGPWTATNKLNITSLILINATTGVIQFGSIDLLTFNDTTDDSPLPFVLENEGNAYVNVTVNASSLWSNAASPTQYYRFKADNISGEAGAFAWAQSVTSFTNVPVAPLIALAQFNYSDAQDSAEIDIYVEAPPNEPPGKKSSIVTFTASLGAQP